MDDKSSPSLKYHKRFRGKLSVIPNVPLDSNQDLLLAYTPGVADVCMEIAKTGDLAFDYTLKSRVVAIISDGSAVLGLGNIGPLAAIPVMEGKAALLYKFSGIEAFPITLDTKDEDEIIRTIKNIAPVFGAIMLEDIAAPKCVRIERILQKELPIPVFHDDQHGTAIVVGAAVTNAFRLLRKDLSQVKAVVCGTGAAGNSVIRLLKELGVGSISAYNRKGIVSYSKYSTYDFVIKELIDERIIDDPDPNLSTLSGLIKDKDLFIGVSAPNILTKEMVESMRPDPVIFALANPIPEINPNLALAAKAFVVGTGRSDYPNQINNVLVFPGLMKGLLESRAPSVTAAMKIAACKALAYLIEDKDLRPDRIIPGIFEKGVVDAVKNAVISAVK
ncbi:MAG: NAD(P)-dependent malic enzyme [Candidatus Izemoplasmatales bacterium]|jgi:malate dehydrogenase (oxaloacetate-decarboxylating)